VTAVTCLFIANKKKEKEKENQKKRNIKLRKKYISVQAYYNNILLFLLLLFSNQSQNCGKKAITFPK